MPRSGKQRARLGLMYFQEIFEPEIAHVIEFEQSADLIMYADTSEPLKPQPRLVVAQPKIEEKGSTSSVDRR